MQRKGMMVGSGKSGYYNVTGRDPMVHSLSARGIKQPQRGFMSINPAIRRYSNEKLDEGAVKEHIEHPKFTFQQARMIARDHLVHNPRAYGKLRFGDRDVYGSNLHVLDNQRILRFREIARERGIDPVLFEEFMMRSFPESSNHSYALEWADRFKTGNPMGYMTKEHRKTYKQVLKDYEESYFGKKGITGGKGGGKLTEQDWREAKKYKIFHLNLFDDKSGRDIETSVRARDILEAKDKAKTKLKNQRLFLNSWWTNNGGKCGGKANRDLGTDFFSGATKGKSLHMKIVDTPDKTLLVGYDWAVYGSRDKNTGKVTFYKGWSGYSVTTSKQLSVSGLRGADIVSEKAPRLGEVV